jgi:hypothetical protein
LAIIYKGLTTQDGIKAIYAAAIFYLGIGVTIIRINLIDIYNEAKDTNDCVATETASGYNLKKDVGGALLSKFLMIIAIGPLLAFRQIIRLAQAIRNS